MSDQPEDMEIGSTRFGCRNCDELLDRVFVGRRGQEEQWLACPSCGWDNKPDWFEPTTFYQRRYPDTDAPIAVGVTVR